MMRRYSGLMALGGFMLLGAASANAADLEAFRARVPFPFKAGKATLPAGDYSFRFDWAELPGVLRVRSADGREGAFVQTQKADVPEGSGGESKLVFEKDGDQYVLSQVLDPDAQFGIKVLKPRPTGEPERASASTD